MQSITTTGKKPFGIIALIVITVIAMYVVSTQIAPQATSGVFFFGLLGFAMLLYLAKKGRHNGSSLSIGFRRR